MADDARHRLILLRHAKSDWSEDVPDHDRPLAKRGQRDAPKVGRWLNRQGYLPGTVVCSTARRTRETWELVSAKLGAAPRPEAQANRVPRPEAQANWAPEVTFEPRAYAASAMTLLYLARELPGTDRARTTLLIAHNPGVSDLASSLTGTHRGGISFPTAGIAVLEFDGEWPDLAPGQARLTLFAVPADM